MNSFRNLLLQRQRLPMLPPLAASSRNIFWWRYFAGDRTLATRTIPTISKQDGNSAFWYKISYIINSLHSSHTRATKENSYERICFQTVSDAIFVPQPRFERGLLSGNKLARLGQLPWYQFNLLTSHLASRGTRELCFLCALTNCASNSRHRVNLRAPRRF